MDNETEYVRRLQEVDDRSQRNEGRIKKLEADQKALLELTSSVRELANEQGHVKQDLAEIKEDVKGLAARPGKRWDSVVSTLLAALVGAFAAWLLSVAYQHTLQKPVWKLSDRIAEHIAKCYQCYAARIVAKSE